jgi:hypothetical protein
MLIFPVFSHVFLETCTHYNAVGFTLAYEHVTINGEQIKPTVDDQALERECAQIFTCFCFRSLFPDSVHVLHNMYAVQEIHYE